MRQTKKMIVENCKLYYRSEERNRIPADRVLPLSDTATYGVSAGRKRTTGATISMQAEILSNEWRLIRDVFLTKLEKRRQFNKQCRRDLYRWFRENEPFINDLAKDIAAAGRTNFKVFKR